MPKQEKTRSQSNPKNIVTTNDVASSSGKKKFSPVISKDLPSEEVDHAEDSTATVTTAEWIEENGRYIFAAVLTVILIVLIIPAMFIMVSATGSSDSTKLEVELSEPISTSSPETKSGKEPENLPSDAIDTNKKDE